MGMKFTHSFLIFIILFIIGDISSTLLFLSNGGIELNPLYHLFGWTGIILLKLFAVACLFSCKYLILKIDSNSIFNDVYTIVYIFLYILCIIIVLSNLTLYFTGLNLFQYVGMPIKMGFCIPSMQILRNSVPSQLRPLQYQSNNHNTCNRKQRRSVLVIPLIHHT